MDVVSAPGKSVFGPAAIEIVAADDPASRPVDFAYAGTATFALPPGAYEVRAEFLGVRATVHAQVAAGRVTKQEVNLGSGTLSLMLARSSSF